MINVGATNVEMATSVVAMIPPRQFEIIMRHLKGEQRSHCLLAQDVTHRGVMVGARDGYKSFGFIYMYG